MRENRTHGSEGGEGNALPDPYQSCRGDRCEKFGASLGVPQHPEQHRRVYVLQVRIVGIELDGAVQSGLGI